MTQSQFQIEIPGWTVVRKLGEGSYGCVYELERTTENDRVERAALKHIAIPKDSSEINDLFAQHYDNETITEHFRDRMEDISKEYATMESLRDNPYVVHCHELKTIQHDDGIGWDIFIRMELLSPLKENLSLDYDERQVLRLGLNMCGALASCHARNIIHRDIKPENILIAPNGSFKLGDFGIAKISEKTSTQTMIGSPGYMAPEVANRQRYGTSADIYSLGMVLYWMMNEHVLPFLPLNKKIPSYDLWQKALDRRLSGEELPTPLNGSMELTRIVMKACSFNSKDRYQNAKELATDLKRCLKPQKQKSPQPFVPDIPSDDLPLHSAPQKVSHSNNEKSQKLNPALWVGVPLLILLLVGGIVKFAGSKKAVPQETAIPQVILAAGDRELTTSEARALLPRIENTEKVENFKFISAKDNPSPWPCYLVDPTDETSAADINKICADLSQIPGIVWTMAFDKDISDDELWATVEKEKGPFEVYCESLEELSSETIELYPNQEWLLHVKPDPENTTDDIQYAIHDESIALVSQDGKLTAVTPGETALSIRCGDISLLKMIRVIGEFEGPGVTVESPFLYYTNDSGVTIYGLRDSSPVSSKFIIPSEIGGEKVTEIHGLQTDGLPSGSLEMVESIYIPETVTQLSGILFSNLFPQISEIVVAEQNQIYASLDGALYSKDLAILLQVPTVKTGTLRIPDSVKAIETTAFYNCNRLEKIIVPTGLSEENMRIMPQNCLLQTGELEYVLYGTYPAGTSNTILWTVLDYDNGKMLLLSKDAISCAPFHISETAATWKDCSIRSWLNNDFLQTAFSESERSKIVDTTLITDSVTTQDKIFLLSQNEVEEYLPVTSLRQASATEHTKQAGVYTSAYGYCWWWLRSSGGSSGIFKAVVNDTGKIAQGYLVNAKDGAIRPAMWIEETDLPLAVE